MIFLNPANIFAKGFLVIAALLSMFVAGLVVGLIAGLILGNTAISDTIFDILDSYRALLDAQLEY
jgi:hypothetical protein